MHKLEPTTMILSITMHNANSLYLSHRPYYEEYLLNFKSMCCIGQEKICIITYIAHIKWDNVLSVAKLKKIYFDTVARVMPGSE